MDIFGFVVDIDAECDDDENLELPEINQLCSNPFLCLLIN